MILFFGFVMAVRLISIYRTALKDMVLLGLVKNAALIMKLFSGVKIILANCIKAIEDREKANDAPVIEEDD